MKILDVQPFHEGLQRNIVMLQRLSDEMEAIRYATEGLVAMDDSLKGEGGNAIRSFYEECHLPFLEFYSMFQSRFHLCFRTHGRGTRCIGTRSIGFDP